MARSGVGARVTAVSQAIVDTSRVLIVMPAFNEERCVEKVVTEVVAHVSGATVLVVDDGSKDATAERARVAGAVVARLAVNLGVGAAMRTGFRYAVRHGYDIVVQVDADGQHDPNDVLELIHE